MRPTRERNTKHVVTKSTLHWGDNTGSQIKQKTYLTPWSHSNTDSHCHSTVDLARAAQEFVFLGKFLKVITLGKNFIEASDISCSESWSTENASHVLQLYICP